MSPLFSSAMEGLSKSLQAVGRPAEAFEALLAALEVLAARDGVHTTPLFEALEQSVQLHDSDGEIALVRLRPLIDKAFENLERRGMAGDGNAGLVMSRAGTVLSRAAAAEDGAEAAAELRARACALLERGSSQIRASHDAGEADLLHEVFAAESLLQGLRDMLR